MKATKKKSRRKPEKRKEEDEIVWALSHQKKMEEAVRRAPKEYKSLLEAQSEKLQDLGLRKGVYDLYKSNFSQILYNLSGIRVGRGNIPVLPIITRNLKSIPDLLQFLSRHEVEANCDLDPSLIKDIERRSHSNLFYHILNVNEGRQFNNSSPLRAEERIMSSRKKPLNVEEAISLCIHSSILDEYHVVALGSLYGNSLSTAEVPIIKKIDGNIFLMSIKRTHDGYRCAYPSKN